MMVSDDRARVTAHWTPAQAAVIKAAAQDPQVERIFVNAAIKKALCATPAATALAEQGAAYWGHDYHFHVRIACPAGESGCKPQAPPPAGDGCGKELDYWLSDAVLHPKPPQDAAEAEAPADHGRSSGRLPAGAGGALTAPGAMQCCPCRSWTGSSPTGARKRLEVTNTMWTATSQHNSRS